MKKTILIIAIAVLGLSSCEQTFVCKCTTVYSNGITEDEIVAKHVEALTDNGGEKKCTELDESDSAETTTCLVFE